MEQDIIQKKADFLQFDYVLAIRSIDPSERGRWGKLSPQGMVEHMADSFRIANGKDVHDCVTPYEHIDKMQAFLRSDKPFKENTVNSMMTEEPAALRWNNMDDALGELQTEINDFIDVFKQNKDKIITNPFFGDLNYDDWVMLLYKHALHHLKQFGSEVTTTIS